MTKGLFGVFGSFIIAAILVGFITWNQTQNRHQMLVEADQLQTLFDQQRADDMATRYEAISR